MIDYCQVILELHQVNGKSWYNTSRDILLKQIVLYNLNTKVRQLSKQDIEQVSISLLDKVKFFDYKNFFFLFLHNLVFLFFINSIICPTIMSIMFITSSQINPTMAFNILHSSGYMSLFASHYFLVIHITSSLYTSIVSFN